MTNKKYKMVKWMEPEFLPIQALIDEVRKETSGRVYDNRVLLDAANFYRKYRKLVKEL